MELVRRTPAEINAYLAGYMAGTDAVLRHIGAEGVETLEAEAYVAGLLETMRATTSDQGGE